MAQLSLSLPYCQSYREEDFIVSGCNQEAHGWVTRWPDWAAYGLIVIGEAGSGKTHLAHIWQERTAARPWREGEDVAVISGHLLVENADKIQDEAALFHLLNLVRERGDTILMTANQPPRDWGIALPDVNSRLNSLPQTTLQPPDDTLLTAILAKHFADRQVRVEPEVLQYVVTRAERSFAGIHALAGRLDATSLDAKRPITLPLVREVMLTGG